MCWRRTKDCKFRAALAAFLGGKHESLVSRLALALGVSMLMSTAARTCAGGPHLQGLVV